VRIQHPVGTAFFLNDFISAGHPMRTSVSLFSLLITACGLVAHSAMAADVAAVELAKANGCYSCHAPTEKVVGPAYSSVAERYKDDKDAVANLVQSIQRGSKGKWGRVPMPAHDTMSPADLKTLATWVMSIKP
jgi:cytochrome c